MATGGNQHINARSFMLLALLKTLRNQAVMAFWQARGG